MSSDTRQLPRGAKPSWRHWKRWLKRQTARTQRREGKRLDEAARRVTKGWTA